MGLDSGTKLRPSEISSPLAVGAIEAGEVATLVLRTSSAEYSESPHHWDQSVAIHTFKPTVSGERWYIKAYFLDKDERTATFVSVHRAGQ